MSEYEHDRNGDDHAVRRYVRHRPKNKPSYSPRYDRRRGGRASEFNGAHRRRMKRCGL